MKNRRIISLTILFVFLFNMLPVRLIGDSLDKIVYADSKEYKELGKEDFKKFEGKISSGGYHTAILREDGTVLASGYNGWDQCEVRNWDNIIEISLGSYNTIGTEHTIGLKEDGTVVAVGNNEYGQGNVDKWNNIVEITTGDKHTVGLKEDGTVVTAGDNSFEQCNIEEWRDVVSISAGGGHTVGLKKDGTVVAVGNNSFGQCDVNNWTDIVSISAGGNHTIGLKKDGTVVAVGRNGGECSVSEWKEIVSISAGRYHTVGLKKDGTVIATGYNYDGECNVSKWNNIVAVSATDKGTVGLQSNGKVIRIGDNSEGQCNINDWSDIVSVETISHYRIGIKDDGSVLMDTNVGIIPGEFQEVKNWSDILQISVSKLGSYIVGLNKDRTVTSAGGNDYGQRNVEGWRDIISISAGTFHTVGLKGDGTVVATGSDSSGQCNVSEWRDIVDVSAGEYHTVGLKSDGTVVATGYNYSGQCNVSEWTDIVSIVAGSQTVGLKSDGTVVTTAKSGSDYGWDEVKNWNNIVKISSNSDHIVGLKEDGTVVAEGSNYRGKCEVNQWSDIVNVSAGSDITLGVKKDGTVVATGADASTIFSYLPNTMSLDNEISKQGDNVKININKNEFYNIENPKIQINNREYIPNKISDDKYELEYKVEEKGSIASVTTLGITDFFGNSFSEKSLLKILPLESISSSKTKVSSGEKVTINVKFNENVDDKFNVSLSGAMKSNKRIMEEVEGSNGTEYTTFYIIPDNCNIGAIDVVLNNVVDNNGVIYNSYVEKDVFYTAINNIPEISAVDTVIKVGEEFNPMNGVTADDKQDGDLTDKIEVVKNEVDTAKVGIYEVVYKVTDSQGASVTKTINVTVRSNEKSVISASDVTLKVGDKFEPMKDVTAIDKEDGDITLDIQVKENTVDTSKEGIYKVVYEASDSDGNIVTKEVKITVRSNEKPVISASDVTLKVGDKFDLMKGVTAIDKEDGDITLDIQVKENTVDTSKEGIYKVVYEVSDSDGNIVTKEVKITVRSNEKPLISTSDVILKVGDEFDPMDGITATDEEDGNITDSIKVIENTVDVEDAGKYKVVYEVTDSDGNTSTKEITVTVNPRLSVINNIPTISVSDVTIKVGDNFEPSLIATANDKEDADITDKIEVVKNEVDTAKVGIYEVVYKVTDSQGASATKIIKVTVRSNEKPVINASDVTLKVGDKFDPMNGVIVKDKEDGDITSKIEVEGKVDTEKAGMYKLVYKVKDSDGNEVTKEITVKVVNYGWCKIDGKWYYYNEDASMKKGWLDDKGTWYYLRSNGEMATGWEQVGSKWYYLSNSGAMQIGWKDLNGAWYYLKSNGEMSTGWEQVGSKWYYLSNSGNMQIGWKDLNGVWYYLKGNGEMATGWEKVGGNWYYLYNSGKMATNTTIDGWKIGAEGVAAPAK